MKSGKTGATFSLAQYSTVLHVQMWTLDALVFRRKDLCEAKHDAGIENLVSKNLFWVIMDWWTFLGVKQTDHFTPKRTGGHFYAKTDWWLLYAKIDWWPFYPSSLPKMDWWPFYLPAPQNGLVADLPPKMDWWPFRGKMDFRCTQAVQAKDHCDCEATKSTSCMSPGLFSTY